MYLQVLLPSDLEVADVPKSKYSGGQIRFELTSTYFSVLL